MPDLTNVTGVGIAGLAVWLMWKLATNHLHHNTMAIQELRDMIQKLISYLEGKK